MASLIPEPEEVRAALKPYVEPDEQLRHFAYAISQSAPLMIAAIVGTMILAALLNLILIGPVPLLSIITFFLIWLGLFSPLAAKLRRDYVVGLTDRRLLLLRVKTPVFTVNVYNTVSFVAYPLDDLLEVETSSKRLKVIVKLRTVQATLKLQFGRVAIGSSRGAALAENAVKLALALRQRQQSPV